MKNKGFAFIVLSLGSPTATLSLKKGRILGSRPIVRKTRPAAVISKI